MIYVYATHRRIGTERAAAVVDCNAFFVIYTTRCMYCLWHALGRRGLEGYAFRGIEVAEGDAHHHCCHHHLDHQHGNRSLSTPATTTVSVWVTLTPKQIFVRIFLKSSGFNTRRGLHCRCTRKIQKRLPCGTCSHPGDPLLVHRAAVGPNFLEDHLSLRVIWRVGQFSQRRVNL